MSEEPRTPERVFGVIPIKGRCSGENCQGRVVSVLPLRLPGMERGGVLWYCSEHAKKQAEALSDQGQGVGVRTNVEEIARTCGTAIGDVPCGAAATHLIVVGYEDPEYGRTLRTVSACERHARPEEEPA